ncbi:hypothetical protein LVJ94_17775 [Pendulispora rubella]|uniref:Alpha/beta hydrolase domain-containing protein n=1 Tax=Pendulispora rubella TaxID=2741070 RepID=A0ABZ2LFB7_9BACT
MHQSMHPRPLGPFACVLLSTLAAACTSHGDQPPVGSLPGYVDDIEVVSVTDAYGGESFGTAGPYEVVSGIVHGKLLPAHPANAGIVDLDRAPVGSDGYVSYTTDFVILRPKNAVSAVPILFYDVANRGSMLGLQALDATGNSLAAGRQGNGFLLRRGYTLVWSGWQGDIVQSDSPVSSGQTVAPIGTRFPIATNAEGPIIGTSREEFVFDNTTNPITFTLSYPASTLDPSQVIFNVRSTWRTPSGMTWDSPSQPIPSSSWQYVDDRHVKLQRPSDADAGAIYSFVYPAKDPIVMGIGFAAVRDFVSFLRNDKADAQGHPSPVADLNYRLAIGEGISQSGRFLRDFTWQGFNDDARGHKVFDGIIPFIGGGRKAFVNARWAQPGRSSREHEDHFQPGDQFPFAYATTTDPLTGKTDGLLAKCTATGSCPKVLQLDGSYEFWGGRASLNVTDGAGYDIPIPENVRLYLSSATQHGGGNGAGTQTALTACQFKSNPVNQSAMDRAIVDRMEHWLAAGDPPPPSNYPTIAAGTLALPESRTQVGFPDLTSVGLTYTGIHNAIHVTNYSNAVPVADTSKDYEIRVPTTDTDGNDFPGFRVPDVSVPLATYLPWNLRKEGYAPGELCGFSGGILPFSTTATERQSKADPRPALLERYADKADYVDRVHAAATAAAGQGFLLEEDVNLFVERAQAVTVFPR